MFKSIKKRLKDQRGLTLVELLAVVVILGIIAAIAVPNIGSIIDNTKKDAHIANAQQMANAARLYNTTVDSKDFEITLGELLSKNLIDQIKDPTATNSANQNYSEVSKIDIVKNGTKTEYKVTLAPSGVTVLTASSILYIKSINANDLIKDDVSVPAVVK